MKFNVHMLAFMNGEIREVEVPAEECGGDVYEVLERIFYWGQNDFQPVKDRASVSVGDVAECFGRYFLVLGAGWKEITEEKFKELKEIAADPVKRKEHTMDAYADVNETKNNKEKTKMSNFNLSGYLKKIFSAKKKEDKQGDQIETKLNEKNKKEEEPQEITEGLLKKDREDTEETTIEKKLEKVRAGSKEMLVEGQLDKSKSAIMKHRNAETAKGNINKLEEKRLAGETMESEKQEPASEADKPRRFWEVKSPDGLKLAKSVKIAQALDYDIDVVDELPRTTPDFRERLSPGALMELDNLRRQELEFKEKEGEDSPEDAKAMMQDIISDPDMLNDVFSEEVVGRDNSTGTMVEEREISFDLKDPDGEIKEIFKAGKNIDRGALKEALLNFISLNHIDDVVDEESLHIDIDNVNLTGSATYMVPVR